MAGSSSLQHSDKPPETVLRGLLSALGLGLGAAGLIIDFVEIVPSVVTVSATNPVARSWPDALVYFWTFFTHLSNLGLVLVYVADISHWRWLAWFRDSVTRASMGAYILLVMLYYHFMLGPYLQFEGPLFAATIILHYLAPSLYLAWWLVFARTGTLRWSDLPMMLVPGLLYVGWTLLRGAVLGEYPYDILDVGKHGFGGVGFGIAVLLLAVATFGVTLTAMDKLWRRAPHPLRA